MRSGGIEVGRLGVVGHSPSTIELCGSGDIVGSSAGCWSCVGVRIRLRLQVRVVCLELENGLCMVELK